MISSKYNWYVGIDISKDTIDAAILPGGQTLQAANNTDGFIAFKRWLLENRCVLDRLIVCMENTGSYDDQLLAFLTREGIDCALEHTRVLSHITPLHHYKDDCYDALGLAEYAMRYTDRLHLWQQPEEVTVELRQLYNLRRQAVTQRGRLYTQIKDEARQVTQHSFAVSFRQEQIQLLNAQIKKIEAEAMQLIESDDSMVVYYNLLRSIPGIGAVTAWYWLITFYGIQRLDARKISSRFGLAPHRQRSGSSVHKRPRSTGHGNREMRKCLAMAARSAGSHKDVFREYKQRKLEQGKKYPIILNNMMNKLIRIACGVWNTGIPFKEEIYNRKASGYTQRTATAVR